MVGETISHFHLLEKLGEGGMGVVYKARDTRLNRLVAIKILSPEKVADTQRKQRFVQEAKAASALNHPNIIQIYEVGEANGTDFISMELVTGKTLDRLIPHHGMRPGEALKYALQIADALGAAHAAGMVHRDLKPGNVMITELGVVKVLDFGLAKLTEVAPPAADDLTRTMRMPMTEDGMIVGTAAYMSPEQAEGKSVDTRSDIFSFGAVLYEMLTGVRAFQGDSSASMIAAILREDPKPASQVVQGLSAEVDRILRRALRKDPAHRIQHMDDLKLALEELKQELDSGTLGAVVAPPQRRRRRLAWVFSLLGTAGVLAAVLWFVRPSARVAEPALIAVPLMTDPGFHGQATFSPEGNQVAFSWDGEQHNNFDIYVKLIGTAGPPLRLTTHPASDHSPAWSPDGRYIAFLRDLDEAEAAVMLVPALGGPERKIALLSRAESLAWDRVIAWDRPTWSADGRSLVISDRGTSATDPFALFLLSIETGERRRLTSPQAPLVGDSGPEFAPDGRSLAFTRVVDSGISDLYLLNFSHGLDPVGEPKQLTFGNRRATSPAWTADGHDIVFANWFGGSGLWRVATSLSMRRPSEPQRLASLGENIFAPAISHQGRRLAYVHRFFHASIGRTPAREAGGGTAGTTEPARTLISSSRDDSSPQFSPDGDRIAFLSARSGSVEIWVCNSDGSNPLQLTSFDGPLVTTPRWSPDGQKIAFDSNAAGQFDIYVVDANGGRPRRMTTHPANDGNPTWSHNGRWIYFDSGRSGEQQIWKTPSGGGEPYQVTHDGAWAPLESPDGKFLFYTKALSETSLWKIPLNGGRAAKVLDGLSSYINLAIVQDGVYFIPVEDASSIHFLSFAANQIRPVANPGKVLTMPGAAGGLAVSPDGQWILHTQFEQAGSELMLVENFR